jgi:hypothetical protein
MPPFYAVTLFAQAVDSRIVPDRRELPLPAVDFARSAA